MVAAFCASDIANDVLPIAGRAARMMSSVGCRPAVLRVEIGEAGRHAGDAARRLEALVERAEHLLDERLDRLGAGLVLALGDLEDLRLGVVEVVADLEAVLVAASRGSRSPRASACAPGAGRRRSRRTRRRCPPSARAARARRGTRCRRSRRACRPSRSRPRA